MNEQEETQVSPEGSATSEARILTEYRQLREKADTFKSMGTLFGTTAVLFAVLTANGMSEAIKRGSFDTLVPLVFLSLMVASGAGTGWGLTVSDRNRDEANLLMQHALANNLIDLEKL
jgi:hypothetical protein